MTTTEPNHTREQLRQHFLPRTYLPVSEIAQLLLMAPGTARNKIAAGDFPIHTEKLGKRRVVRLDDLINFLCPAPAKPEGRRGRPTKREQLARANRGERG